MEQNHLITPPLPGAHDNLITWPNLPGDSLALVLAEAARQYDGPIVVITADGMGSTRLADALRFFIADDKLPVLGFPDWETLPYDSFSPHQTIISERLLTLSHINQLNRGIILISVSSLMQRIAPKTHLDAHSLVLTKGQQLNIEDFRQRLQTCGYHCVDQVISHGEYAVRGSLLDIYPMGSELPYRIDLFDDEIDSLRCFDPDTQLTINTIETDRSTASSRISIE